MPVTFHTPPTWSPPPAGFMPTSGWTPDPAWGPAPTGWVFYTSNGRPIPAPQGAWQPPEVTPTPLGTPGTSPSAASAESRSVPSPALSTAPRRRGPSRISVLVALGVGGLVFITVIAVSAFMLFVARGVQLSPAQFDTLFLRGARFKA